MGYFRFAETFFLSLLMHEFFSGETLYRIFFSVDRHYFLAFFTTFNNRYVYGMQYESFMLFFFLFVDGTCLVACSGGSRP